MSTLQIGGQKDPFGYDISAGEDPRRPLPYRKKIIELSEPYRVQWLETGASNTTAEQNALVDFGEQYIEELEKDPQMMEAYMLMLQELNVTPGRKADVAGYRNPRQQEWFSRIKGLVGDYPEPRPDIPYPTSAKQKYGKY